jgi:ABC-2 type transport system permease protein
MTTKHSKHSKIILAIARKDIAQAFQDRMILGVIIGVFLLILPSQLIPLILENENTPLAVIYGSEPTALANALTALSNTSAFSVKSLPYLRDEIASGRNSMIGLVLPDDFSQKVSAKEIIQIDAYIPHWTKLEAARQLEAHFENKIQLLTDAPVDITIVDDQVYPDEDTRGSQVMFILQMVNAIMTITFVLVPQLMMVEKETHTLDALLISPASLTDLVISKGLVGIFFSAIAVVMVIMMNIKFIAHWPLLIVSVISGISFAVLTGLLIGLLFDNFQQATFVMWIVVMVAIAPAFVKTMLTISLPSILTFMINWLPSGQLASLLMMSLMKTVDLPAALLGLGSIWAANFLLFGATLWQIKQQMK